MQHFPGGPAEQFALDPPVIGHWSALLLRLLRLLRLLPASFFKRKESTEMTEMILEVTWQPEDKMFPPRETHVCQLLLETLQRSSTGHL